jgi:glycerol-3-phosphate dehydrogenase (NAD(P)+)
MRITSVGVVGAGAWGTALANLARVGGHDTILWAHEPEVVAAINERRQNPLFLPDLPVAPGIVATQELARPSRCGVVLLATPAQHLRAVTIRLAPALAPGTPVVICAKGIEEQSHKLLSEVVAETVPQARIAVLSGPTFAREVARGLPTAVTLACGDAAIGRAIVEALGSRSFRPYLSDDVIGAQVGGAVKNVLAIAAGIVQGRELGDNAGAALIARGLAEMLRLGEAMGGRRETLMGLSGLGDLVLTCGSAQSRNNALGRALATGAAARAYLAERRSVAEGAFSAQAVVALAERHRVDMPICQAVDAILSKRASVEEAITALLSRPFRIETT